MRIREGDPLEIYTDREGEVIFKKYSPIGELSASAAAFAETLNKTCGVPFLVADRDAVIAAAGASRKDYMDRRISEGVEQVMKSRRLYAARDRRDAPADAPQSPFCPTDLQSPAVSVAAPILSEGDVIGAVISLEAPEVAVPSEVEQKLCQAAAMYLGRQLEA